MKNVYFLIHLVEDEFILDFGEIIFALLYPGTITYDEEIKSC